MNPQKMILDEVMDKYGEYIEEAGASAPGLIISILAQMVHNERETNIGYKNEWYKSNRKDSSSKYS